MVPDNEWRIPTLIGSDDSARTSEGLQDSDQAGGDCNEFQKLASVHGSIRDYRMPDDCLASGFEQSLCHSE